MITLRRGIDTIQLTSRLWESLQIVAKQHGWRPAGALDLHGGQRHNLYRPVRLILEQDATGMAAALERFVNSAAADNGELDLVALVRLVNFLRGGAFEIR